jgi:hypothetical protein
LGSTLSLESVRYGYCRRPLLVSISIAQVRCTHCMLTHHSSIHRPASMKFCWFCFRFMNHLTREVSGVSNSQVFRTSCLDLFCFSLGDSHLTTLQTILLPPSEQSSIFQSCISGSAGGDTYRRSFQLYNRVSSPLSTRDFKHCAVSNLRAIVERPAQCFQPQSTECLLRL